MIPGDFLFGNLGSGLLIRIGIFRWLNDALDNLGWLLVGREAGIDSDCLPFGIQAIWTGNGSDGPDIENVDSDSTQTTGAASRKLERLYGRDRRQRVLRLLKERWR